MKKSYKLLGVIWDQLPITSSNPCVVEYDSFIEDYQADFNLFDVETYKRKINISEILEIEKETALQNIIKKLSRCDEVYILLDYIPQYSYNAVNEFYQKRIIQIFSYFTKVLHNSKVFFMVKEVA